MKIQRTLRSCVQLFACVLLAQVFLACDDRKPTEPPLPEPKPKQEVKDYVAYFFHSDTPYTLYAYHTATGVVDSTLFPFQNPMTPEVSADGRFIYVPSGGVVTVLDTGTLKITSTFPTSGRISVSPDNQYLAVFGQELVIYSVADHSVYFEDSVQLNPGYFTKNSERFYSFYGEGGYQYIYVLDLENDNKVSIIQLPDAEGVHQVIPSRDETQLYLYRRFPGIPDLYLLDVYDRPLDSIIFTWWFRPGSGEMQLSPDGNELYFSAPGRVLMGYPPMFSLGRLNLQTFAADSLIRFFECEGDRPMGGASRDIVLTPDGRCIVSTDAFQIGAIRIYNLQDSTLDTTICIGNDKFFVRMTMQNGL